MKKGYSAILLAGAASAPMMMPVAVHAMEAAGLEAQDQASTTPYMIEDIVVTANRRAERSQDVPIMISAFSSQDLDKLNINEAQDLYGSVPSLVVGTQGTSSRDVQSYSIRGQSTGFLALPSVATYFSEVPLVSSISLSLQGGAGNFVDLENVQVLSGPQGTLFGRNTTGGAVLLTPKRPTNEWEGYVQGSIGNYDLRSVDGAVNLPIVEDKVMVRVTGAYHDRRGFTKDLVWDKWRDDQHWYMGRVGIQINPTETISNNLTISASRSRNNSAGYVHLAFNNAARPISCGVSNSCDVYDRQTEIAQQIGPRRTRLSQDIYSNIDSFMATNTTDVELSDTLTLRNIISYQNLKVDYAGDTDGTPLQVYQLTQSAKFPDFPIPSLSVDFGIAPDGYFNGGQTRYPRDHVKQFSEELQLQGKLLDGKLDFTIGGFFIDATPDGDWESYTVQFCPAYSTGSTDCAASRSIGGVSNKSRALYGQATLNFGAFSNALSDLRFTAGYRYTWDRVEGHSRTWSDLPDGGVKCTTLGGFGDVPEDCAFSADLKTKAPTWTAVLDYKPFRGLMVFAKATRGYKAGGFNNVAVREEYQTFKPERLTSYELGFKSDWRIAGAPGRLNMTYHYADYDNIQRPGSDFNFATGAGGASILAAKGTIQGIEAEASISPWQGLTIGGTLSHTDAEYTEYTFTSLGADYSCKAGGGFELAGFGQTVDASCMPFQFVTPWMYNIHADATLPLGKDLGDLNFYVGYSHFSGQPTAPAGHPSFQPGSILEAYGLLNMSVDWRNVAQSGVDVGVFVTNATNKLYRVSNTNIFNDIGVWSTLYGEPRMFGLKLRYSYGR